jgi:hypothetical protein
MKLETIIAEGLKDLALFGSTPAPVEESIEEFEQALRYCRIAGKRVRLANFKAVQSP